MKKFQPINVNELLNQAILESNKWETPLGKEKKGRAEKAFTAMRHGKLVLDNPQAYIRQLSYKDFIESSVPILPTLLQDMKQPTGHNYYVLELPALLFPGRGAEYSLLECQVEVKVKKKNHIGIQNIFPQPFWNPILQWGGNLKLGLDGQLNWVVEVDGIDATTRNLGGVFSGKIANVGQALSFITVSPYKHELGRMEVEAQFSSKTAMWRLDSREVIRNQKNVRFVVFFKVPKQVTEIKVEAAAQAEVSVSWLMAHVEHVLERLSDSIRQRIREFFDTGHGIPLQEFQTWHIKLPQ